MYNELLKDKEKKLTEILSKPNAKPASHTLMFCRYKSRVFLKREMVLEKIKGGTQGSFENKRLGIFLTGREFVELTKERKRKTF